MVMVIYLAQPAQADPPDDPSGGPTGEGTCEGVCGGSGGGCFCDAACTGYGDCCDDFTEMCVGTCRDSCGARSWDGTCWCDSLCDEYGDCCDDEPLWCGPEVIVGMVVNEAQYDVTWEDAETIVALASDMLEARNGVRMRLQDVEYYHEECDILGPSWCGAGTERRTYLENHRTEPPHYIIALWASYQTVSRGGVNQNTLYVDGSRRTDFVSPYHEPFATYAADLAFAHRFGACGYDLDAYYADGTTWEQISDYPVTWYTEEGRLQGQCLHSRFQPCVFNEAVGYNVCAHLSPDHPKLQHRFSFLAHGVVHELLHDFGGFGNDDHFGTDTCDGMMLPEEYEDELGEYTSALYATMCPYTFDNLVEGYVEY